jgi:hypothetical protein
MPETVSNPTSPGPFDRSDVTTSRIASPISRMVVGGGGEPSGVTRRPDTRTEATGRRLIDRSARSSPESSVISVAAPAVDAAG